MHGAWPTMITGNSTNRTKGVSTCFQIMVHFVLFPGTI